jgi:hypothetical protein
MSKTKRDPRVDFKLAQPRAERKAEGRRLAERRARLEAVRTREEYGHREWGSFSPIQYHIVPPGRNATGSFTCCADKRMCVPRVRPSGTAKLLTHKHIGSYIHRSRSMYMYKSLGLCLFFLFCPAEYFPKKKSSRPLGTPALPGHESVATVPCLGYRCPTST